MLIRDIDTLQEIRDKRAVLLQSGGLDSCFLASLLNYLGFEIHHVFIDWGQNARKQEKRAVKNIVKEYGGELHIVTLNLPWLKDSTLLVGHEVDNYLVDRELGAVKTKIYVPLRNHVFLSIGASLAETLKIKYLVSGLDGKQNEEGKPISGTTDKHINFAETIQESINEASVMRHVDKEEINLVCPLLEVEKEDTIYFGTKFLNTKWELSWSCYNDSDKPCGLCPTCVSRMVAFDNLGIEDLAYKDVPKLIYD